MNDAAAGTARLRVREIAATDRPGLETIAGLHMELLGFGTMAGLGHEFVREICYRANMVEGALRVFLAEIDGEPAGFVAVTPFARTFHRRGLSDQLGLAAWQTLKAVLRKPARLRALLRSLRELGTRRDETAEKGPEPGEVVCIAVRPAYLAPRFMRSSGIRLSEVLVRHCSQYLQRAGTTRMRMLVGADNKPVLMLYHLLGARFRDVKLGDSPNVEVTFDLEPAPWRTAGGTAEGDEWSEYWEGIDEHKKVFRIEARDHVQRLLRLVPVTPATRALDFGCGFGFVACELAPYVASVALWDGAASVRRRARARTAHLGNVELGDPFEPGPRYDLITVHSVVQYMTVQELRDWLERWRGLLAPGGRLVLSDLLQPDTSSVRELARYLVFALRNGFFWDAFVEGVREISRYWKARQSRPLTIVTPGKIGAWGKEAGFTVRVLADNLSYRASRRTAVLTNPPAA
jgi:cyclopropane fatty-acyl-phospholipid synthase-like methyltransferase